jgi:single-strand DNA-binding protein
MASSLNKVILIGRLGKDPEVRFTQGGQAVANFSIATDESYKNNAGEKVEKTEWHNLVVWGNAVESYVAKYLHKGDLIYVEGKLQTRSWEKDGVKKYTTEVNVLDIKGLITQRSDDQPSGGNSRASGKPANQRSAAHTRTQREVADEDIPF